MSAPFLNVFREARSFEKTSKTDHQFQGRGHSQIQCFARLDGECVLIMSSFDMPIVRHVRGKKKTKLKRMKQICKKDCYNLCEAPCDLAAAQTCCGFKKGLEVFALDLFCFQMYLIQKLVF